MCISFSVCGRTPIEGFGTTGTTCRRPELHFDPCLYLSAAPHAQSVPPPRASPRSAMASINASLVLPESRVFLTRTNTDSRQIVLLVAERYIVKSEHLCYIVSQSFGADLPCNYPRSSPGSRDAWTSLRFRLDRRVGSHTCDVCTVPLQRYHLRFRTVTQNHYV